MGGFLLKEINHTNMTLIPNRDDPSVVGHFRPISLCNVLYKTISRILANRLRPFLNNLISPMQSAFISGRLITDNNIVAQEILHYIKYKQRNEGLMAMKFDMEKAYDKIEWSFILVVLNFFSFEDKVWLDFSMYFHSFLFGVD